VQRLEDKNGQLKVDSLADWKPMELPKDWSDVVTPPGSGHQSRGSVLNSLKPLHQAVCDTVHDRITVVQAGRNKRLDEESYTHLTQVLRCNFVPYNLE